MGKPKKFWLYEAGDGVPEIYARKKDVKGRDWITCFSGSRTQLVLGRQLRSHEMVAVRLVPHVEGDKARGGYLRKTGNEYRFFRSKKNARENDIYAESFCAKEFEAVTGMRLVWSGIVRVRLEEV